MTEPIENVISAICTILATGVTALQDVPVNPPETANMSTFALVYAQNGNITNGVVGDKKSLHNISVDALTKRTDLGFDMARIKPFVDQIPAVLLANTTLTATAQTFDGISYELITPDYANVPMIGYKFVLRGVKVLVPSL
jgi:hypothetical protein